MLLEHEKDGTGSKRMSRASAFLECASILDGWADRQPTGTRRREFTKAADEFRDKAVRERNAHDAERAAARIINTR